MEDSSDINEKYMQGSTPLHNVMEFGNLEIVKVPIVKLLIDRGSGCMKKGT